MALPQNFIQGFVKQWHRVGFKTLPPFLQHHVALFGKSGLVHLQPGHSFGFHRHHQLQFCNVRKFIIAGFVIGRIGIAYRPVFFRQPVKSLVRQPFRAAKHHMLQQVRNSALAFRVINRPRLVIQHLQNNRRLMVLDHCHFQPVAKRKVRQVHQLGFRRSRPPA